MIYGLLVMNWKGLGRKKWIYLFECSLFNDVSSSDYIALNERITDE
jgi:hypothetical protein